ncbi:MAG: DedA family protein [Bacillota bacterium]|nr:DedA family protein [Bacillota bacterium]
MANLIDHIVEFIMHIVRQFGYFGIAGGMFLESACIPIPSEAVLPVAGMMVAEKSISMLVANIAVNIGSMLGSLLAYSVGYYGGRPFILKYGKYFFVSADHFHKAENTFNRFGPVTVFFGRLLPIIRTFISLPAGIAKMNIGKFIAFSLIGMIPWNFTLIWLGFKLGENYKTKVSPFFHKFEDVVIAAVVLVIVVIVLKVILGRRKKKSVQN